MRYSQITDWHSHGLGMMVLYVVEIKSDNAAWTYHIGLAVIIVYLIAAVHMETLLRVINDRPTRAPSPPPVSTPVSCEVPCVIDVIEDHLRYSLSRNIIWVPVGVVEKSVALSSH